jgi:hypothetical protein
MGTPPPTAVTTTTIGVGVTAAVSVAFTARATRVGSAETHEARESER